MKIDQDIVSMNRPKVRWEQEVINKLFDDGNNGHFYVISDRLFVFMWIYPRYQRGYGKRNIKQKEIYKYV